MTEPMGAVKAVSARVDRGGGAKTASKFAV